MSKKLISIIIFVFGLVILALNSIFIVTEGQQALVTRLGKICKNVHSGQPKIILPGLHIKLPLLELVLRFDTRIQTLTIDKTRIMTQQKKDVLVDYYIKWRIVDLASYFISTGGNKSQAERLLMQQINNGLRAEFGKHGIEEVVSDARSKIMSMLNKNANISAIPLGIEVIDVRIKTIDLPDEVSAAVFNRMRAERARVASERRSEGQAMAEAIRAKADADSTVIMAIAKTQAAKVMAEGEREAAKLYSAAYHQHPKFYAFYRSLETYRKIFSKTNDVVVLSANSDFFKYFNNANATSGLAPAEKQ